MAASTPIPEGCRYHSDAIPVEMEKSLLEFLCGKGPFAKPASPWENGPGGRRVKQWGARYCYDTKTMKPADPIPPEVQRLIDHLVAQKVVGGQGFQPGPGGQVPTFCGRTGPGGQDWQVIVNEYTPGQGITAHTDHKEWFGEEIVSVTLSGATTIYLAHGSHIYPQRLETRSALVLSGPSRWQYTHCIPNRKSDLVNGVEVPRGTRISITLRHLTEAAWKSIRGVWRKEEEHITTVKRT
jgi:alkylated DNA repair dioxygenase AlkB